MKKKKICLLGVLILSVGLSGCSFQKKTVKWLISDWRFHGDYTITEKEINRWLDDAEKDYTIEFVTYPSESDWEDIKKLAEEEKADIIDMTNDATENSPKADIMKAIAEDYCMEITEEYPESDLLKYNGKLYGYGNVMKQAISGISYSERYLKETGLTPEELTDTFVDNEDSRKFLQKHKTFVSSINSPEVLSKMHIVGEVFYVDQFTGKCGYLYDHPQVKKMMNDEEELIKKGYRSNPDAYGKVQEPDVTLQEGGSFFEKYNELVKSNLNGMKYVFKPQEYTYNVNNVQNIENIIRKGAVNSEEAKDFLNELYSNPVLCNCVLYGEEQPEFPEIKSFEDFRKVYSMLLNSDLCNENLVDEPGGWTVARKEKSYKEYQKQYKDSKIEGFQFVLPESLDKDYEAVQEIICPQGVRTAEYNLILNKCSGWEKMWNKLKDQIEEAGGNKIIEELQRQVDAYIAEK